MGQSETGEGLIEGFLLIQKNLSLNKKHNEK